MCHKILIRAVHLNRVEKSILISRECNATTRKGVKFMPIIIDFDLSEPMAKTLIGYAAQTNNSMNAESQIVEEALIEYFERHRVKIEA